MKADNHTLAKVMLAILLLCIVSSLLYTGILSYMNIDNSIYRKNVRGIVNYTQSFTDVMGNFVPKIDKIPSQSSFQFYPWDKVKFIQHIYAVNWFFGIIETILIVALMCRACKEMQKNSYMLIVANSIKKPVGTFIASILFVIAVFFTEYFSALDITITPFLVPVTIISGLFFLVGTLGSAAELIRLKLGSKNHV